MPQMLTLEKEERIPEGFSINLQSKLIIWCFKRGGGAEEGGGKHTDIHGSVSLCTLSSFHYIIQTKMEEISVVFPLRLQV